MLDARAARQPRALRLERARLQAQKWHEAAEGLPALMHALLQHMQAHKPRGIKPVLDSRRVAYADAQLSMHAPQPALQEEVEAIICASKSRTSRLFLHWVRQPQKSAVVLDFSSYLARLVVAQHALSESYLPVVELCCARMVLHRLHPTLWPESTHAHHARDATACEAP